MHAETQETLHWVNTISPTLHIHFPLLCSTHICKYLCLWLLLPFNIYVETAMTMVIKCIIELDRKVWQAAAHWVTNTQTQLATEHARMNKNSK